MKNKRENKAPHRDTDLGTTDFGSHMEKDFRKEANAIKREMKDLGLK